MREGGGFHHRSSLKQSNKPFKSKHATKGSIKRQNKGRLEKCSSQASSNVDKARVDRIHQRKQEQKKRREELLALSRKFTGAKGIPKVIAIVALCPNLDTNKVVQKFFEANDTEFACFPADGIVQLYLKNHKQKLQLISVKRNLLDVLDAAKISDYVLFVVSATRPVDHFGHVCLSALKAQGLPRVVACAQHVEKLPAGKRRQALASLSLFVQNHFAKVHDVFDTFTSQGVQSLLRHFTLSVPRPINWRERYSLMRVERCEFLFRDDATSGALEQIKLQETVTRPSESSRYGDLFVTGWIRNQPLSSNRLVHIPNWGDYRIKRIERALVSEGSNGSAEIRGLSEPVVAGQSSAPSLVFEEGNPSTQESLVSENIPDIMETEQTWPTDEEIADADKGLRQALKKSTKTKSVPKGTSSYQAAWIVDDEDQFQVGSCSGDEMDIKIPQETRDALLANSDIPSDEEVGTRSFERGFRRLGDQVSSGDEHEEIEIGEREEIFANIDPEQEEADYNAFLAQRRAAAADDQFFPDEIDIPRDVLARTRFRKYRGLKSFRSSNWDPYENLPEDYARVFQFKNFERTRKRVLADIGDEGVGVGEYVTVVLENVPEEVKLKFQVESTEYANAGFVKPFYIVSLLPNEHKMSVLNMRVKRHASSDPSQSVIKSKDPVILQIGFRRYVCSPIYSADTRGSANNVHKFQRYFLPGAPAIATAYLPVHYAPCPVLMFRYSDKASGHCKAPHEMFDFEEQPSILATGGVEEVEPNRIIAKRSILTGHPFKVHKRSAVIRYMFWNADDVNWFKPIELVTKYGRRGAIKESLGTHGYMKCIFDGLLKPHDTVMLNLYKRVYPKWTTMAFSEGVRDKVTPTQFDNYDDATLDDIVAQAKNATAIQHMFGETRSGPSVYDDADACMSDAEDIPEHCSVLSAKGQSNSAPLKSALQGKPAMPKGRRKVNFSLEAHYSKDDLIEQY